MQRCFSWWYFKGFLSDIAGCLEYQLDLPTGCNLNTVVPWGPGGRYPQVSGSWLGHLQSSHFISTSRLWHLWNTWRWLGNQLMSSFSIHAVYLQTLSQFYLESSMHQTFWCGSIQEDYRKLRNFTSESNIIENCPLKLFVAKGCHHLTSSRTGTPTSTIHLKHTFHWTKTLRHQLVGGFNPPQKY